MPHTLLPGETGAVLPATPPEGVTATAHAVGRGAAEAAAKLPLLGHLVRLGHIVRGIIYFLPGLLALRLAIATPGGTGAAITPTGAIDLIAQQPLGRFLMVPIAVGLAAYALWGGVRAVLDPLDRGHSTKGILTRLGYLTSAVAFAGLFFAAFQFLSGASAHVLGDRDWTASVLSKPAGRWIVGIIGVCWIAGAGITQMVIGWKGLFADDLKRETMSATEYRWAVRLGRIGITARGVVFTVIGMLLVGVALKTNPSHVQGMDGALLTLSQQPFGRLLIAGVGLGLMAFGAFSMMCARWMRLTSSGSSHSSQPRRHPNIV